MFLLRFVTYLSNPHSHTPWDSDVLGFRDLPRLEPVRAPDLLPPLVVGDGVFQPPASLRSCSSSRCGIWTGAVYTVQCTMEYVTLINHLPAAAANRGLEAEPPHLHLLNVKLAP